MSVVTGSINIYNSLRKRLLDGTIDLDSHTFKVLLTTSTYVPSITGHTVLADVTNELVGNGYSRQTLAGVTLVQSGAVVTFDCDDPVFAASGGNWTARYFVVYDDTPTSPADPLMVYGLLDATPADVTVTDGNQFSLIINASGLLRLT